jgi:hypothetical protein
MLKVSFKVKDTTEDKTRALRQAKLALAAWFQQSLLDIPYAGNGLANNTRPFRPGHVGVNVRVYQSQLRMSFQQNTIIHSPHNPFPSISIHHQHQSNHASQKGFQGFRSSQEIPNSAGGKGRHRRSRRLLCSFQTSQRCTSSRLRLRLPRTLS